MKKQGVAVRYGSRVGSKGGENDMCIPKHESIRKAPEVKELRDEIESIREKYYGASQWCDSVEEEIEIYSRNLHKQKIIEQIITLLSENEYNVQQCEDILEEAQRRIKIISTPKMISDYPHNHAKVCD